MHTFELTTGEISKIEGKCSLSVKVEDDKIIDLKFAITEFKRFYTQALRGKDVIGLPQLSCRICGTCSNAHLLCAIKAAENALGIVPTQQTILLRKLLNYGLIIRDHALHLYVFSLPDILGVDNILELDENKPEEHQILDDTFTVKAAGNNLAKVIGGRSVHAPYPAVGGFMKLPQEIEFPKLIEELEAARPAILRLINRFTACNFQLDRDITYVAQVDEDFSFLSGDIHQSSGERVKEDDFGNYLEHVVIPYSHASGYTWKGSVHMLGALSRVNLGKDMLHKRTKEDAKLALERFPSKNLYDNNVAQAIEILHSIDASIDILKNLHIVDEKVQPIVRKAGTGIGVIEAPRGTLYYKIELNEKGVITNVDIVVPTGQNQIGIEGSLREYIGVNLDKEKDMLIHESEKIVRAYDPCMSCASHFLKVKWKKSKTKKLT